MARRGTASSATHASNRARSTGFFRNAAKPSSSAPVRISESPETTTAGVVTPRARICSSACAPVMPPGARLRSRRSSSKGAPASAALHASATAASPECASTGRWPARRSILDTVRALTFWSSTTRMWRRRSRPAIVDSSVVMSTGFCTTASMPTRAYSMRSGASTLLVTAMMSHGTHRTSRSQSRIMVVASVPHTPGAIWMSIVTTSKRRYLRDASTSASDAPGAAAACASACAFLTISSASAPSAAWWTLRPAFLSACARNLRSVDSSSTTSTCSFGSCGGSGPRPCAALDGVDELMARLPSPLAAEGSMRPTGVCSVPLIKMPSCVLSSVASLVRTRSSWDLVSPSLVTEGSRMRMPWPIPPPGVGT
mmetsp:Transcript_2461/g.8360  ORF Transcript_2461/g.8360 Transcript_2461/m.8360 type:complete len:369 (-) Transcript_2461:2509-3615(-)